MYTDHNGHPQVLLAKGAISNPSAGKWNSVALPPVQVTGGATYWLALLGVNGAVRFRDRYGTCRFEVGRHANLSSLPATWATGFGWSTCVVSMFATGSVTARGTTPSAAVAISFHVISLRAGQQQQFATAYTDSSVQSGNTYYYVTTAVDTTGVESIFSNEMPSVIPAP
jgi:hypothetical protein